DEVLGGLLLRNALKTLARLEPPPAALLFMNGGVRLCCQGSDVLEVLHDLEGLGVELLCCGTCLDFFHLKEKLAAGRVSNMLEILSRQGSAERLIRL
ncbi:MAG: DsrE family protein, partial [Deltaproteobacteria bacterium]|nr:DsrE family protein [Deltaproteobacteria bacterium]